MAIVTIIGAGMMGSALAFPVRENGHEVRLVSPPNFFVWFSCRKMQNQAGFANKNSINTNGFFPFLWYNGKNIFTII